MLNLMKKKTTTEKSAIQITPNQKATTTVANVAGKVKTGAFGVATGAGIAGTMMLQNEKGIRNRKARAEYHKKVEAVCTVAVGAAVVGAGAAIVQSIFDPVIDVSMLEIEPAAYVELNDKGSAIQEAAQKAEEIEPAEGTVETVEAEHVEAEIVPEKETAAPASAPKAEKPIVEATATEQPAPVAPAPKDATPAPAAPKAEKSADPVPAAPADPVPAAQTNQGSIQPKSDAGKQQPNGNGQGANNNPKNGNNHAKAAK